MVWDSLCDGAACDASLTTPPLTAHHLSRLALLPPFTGFKAEGNAHMSGGRALDALATYARALEHDPLNKAVLGNMAQVRLACSVRG